MSAPIVHVSRRGSIDITLPTQLPTQQTPQLPSQMSTPPRGLQPTTVPSASSVPASPEPFLSSNNRSSLSVGDKPLDLLEGQLPLERLYMTGIPSTAADSPITSLKLSPSPAHDLSLMAEAATAAANAASRVSSSYDRLESERQQQHLESQQAFDRAYHSYMSTMQRSPSTHSTHSTHSTPSSHRASTLLSRGSPSPQIPSISSSPIGAVKLETAPVSDQATQHYVKLLEAENGNLSARTLELERKLREAQRGEAAMHAKIEEYKTESIRLAESALQAEEEKRLLANEFAATQGALASSTRANRDMESLRARIKKLEKERGEISAAYRDANSRVEDMELEIVSRKEENSRLLSDLESTKARLLHMDGEHERLTEATRDELRMLEAAQNQAQQLEARLLTTSASLDLAQEEGRVLRDQVKGGTTANDKLRKMLEEQQKRHSRQNMEWERKSASWRSDRKKLEGKVVNTSTKAQRVEAAWNEERKSWMRERKRWEREREAFKQSLVEIGAERVELLQLREAARNKEEELQQSRALAQSQIEIVKRDAMVQLAALQENIKLVQMQASQRLQQEESRRMALEQEYVNLKALVQPQTETMEDLAAELQRALERERSVQNELSISRVRENGLSTALAKLQSSNG